jgi:hypothetical protein
MERGKSHPTQDDIWTASLLLSNSLPNFCEYKYIVSDWEHVSPRTATWEVGDHNRKLDIDINKTLTCCGITPPIKTIDGTWTESV